MRKLAVMLTLALLGSAAMSAWLWIELRAERARNAELSAHSISLPTPLAAAEAVTATPAPAPAPASPAAEKSAAKLAASPPQGVERSAQEEAEASQRLMLQQPKYREAWRAQQRLNYALRRENVIRLLGFTPEEADAVVEIAIDRQLIWMDLPQQKPMTQENGQQLQALAEQYRREDEAKFRELLGDERYARFQQYMDSRSTRAQVDEIRPKFTGADTLRDEQVEPLIAALHVERARLHAEQQEYRASVRSDLAPNAQQASERELELLRAAHERMHTATASILSGSQLKRLDALLKRDLDRQVLEARMLSGTPDADIANTD